MLYNTFIYHLYSHSNKENLFPNNASKTLNNAFYNMQLGPIRMVPWFFRLIPVLIAAFDDVSFSVALQEFLVALQSRVYVGQIDSFAQFLIPIQIPIYLLGD